MAESEMGGIFDIIVFVLLVVSISVYGIVRSCLSGSGDTSSKSKYSRDASTSTTNDQLLGSNVSVFSVALCVCSTFISAISILGFPSEVYYRGTMMCYYFVMYAISFPISAFVFLPVFYRLKMRSVYEYLERRFCFTSRIIASATFAVQTLLYESAALYAPALALTSLIPISFKLSIIITASMSAIYLCAGGARAGIYTSALQMALIMLSMMLICVVTLIQHDVGKLFTNVRHGGRFVFDDFRVDPRIRHSAWALVIGGSGNIFNLFSTNQLTVQRYMCLPTLRKAQQVVLLNIPMNGLVLSTYLVMGLAIYGVYHGCHPLIERPDKLITYYINDRLSWLPGLQGIFMAAIYSAGVSTLTASYNALTAITIEDVIKYSLARWGGSSDAVGGAALADTTSPVTSANGGESSQKTNSGVRLSARTEMLLVQWLPFAFAAIAAFFAFLLSKADTIILQLAFSIFGGAGGTILGIFCVGLFCPWITADAAVVGAQLASIVVALCVAVGAFVNNVRPVSLPLATSCPADVSHLVFTNTTSDFYGSVTSTHDYSEWWTTVSEVSYQSYSMIGVLVTLVVTHFIQLIVCIISGDWKRKPVDPSLLATFMRPRVVNNADYDANDDDGRYGGRNDVISKSGKRSMVDQRTKETIEFHTIAERIGK